MFYLKNINTRCKSLYCRALCLFLILFAVEVPALEIPAVDELIPMEKAEVKKLTLVDIYTLSNTLPKELIDLEGKTDGLTGVAVLKDKLPHLQKQVVELEHIANREKTNPHPSYHRFSSLDSRVVILKEELDALERPIESNLEQLGAWQREWLEKQHTLLSMQQQVAENPELSSTLQLVDSISEVISEATELIDKEIQPNIQTGQEISAIQARVYLLGDIASELIQEMNALNLSKTSPSILSAHFYQGIDSLLMEQGWHDICLFWQYQWYYIQDNLAGLLISPVVILLVALLLQMSKSKVQASSGWSSFTTKPISTSVFIVGAAFFLINNSPVRIILPPEWDNLLLLPLIVAVTMLTQNFCSTAWQNSLLRRLCLFLAVIRLFTIMELPPPFIHQLVLYISAVGFLYYLYHFIRRLRTESGQKITWAFWMWGLFPVVIIVAGITGYDQLAVFIFEVVLSLLVASLAIMLLLRIITGLLEMLLLNIPVEIIRRNTTVIVKHTMPILALLHGVLWLSITLMIFRVNPTLYEALDTITSVQFTLYTLTVSPGSVLMVAFICYATLLCSRGLRAFLTQVVLTNYGVKSGTQVSIARLVHYAIFMVGFFILLKLLGCSLNQVAILGGALGVGIGFGLQAIVNNFVSGLILLFERPIKVGDVIELDGEVGEVKDLGLRATIVKTNDDAEIVIPNSELITSNVTNWTLAEKQARVKVPVSVAYGSDIAKVMEILLASGVDNQMVLSQPKPEAYFLSFAASSMDFELWVWIPDFSETTTVLSELNQEIEARFQLAGIEMPFPQRDLHLRTIDKEAGSILQHLTAGGIDRGNTTAGWSVMRPSLKVAL